MGARAAGGMRQGCKRTEVADLGDPLAREEHVLCLDVPVDDLGCVRVHAAQALSHLVGELQPHRPWERRLPLVEHIFQ